MQIREDNGCFDLLDDIGCILTLNKKNKTIIIWESAVDSMEENAFEKNEKEGVWLVMRRKTI